MNNQLRDKNLDRLRAVAMMWVLGIHTVYWNDLFSSNGIIIRSFFLIEMPLMFFVTGASNMKSSITNYGQFVIKRLKRIIIPYWVYALVVCIINVDKGVDYDGMLVDFFTFKGAGYGCTCWALWFIPTYIQIIILYPLMKKYFLYSKKTMFKILPFLLSILMVFVLSFDNSFVEMRKVFLYGGFTYLGCFYDDLKKYEKKYNMGIIACVAVLCIMILYKNNIYGLNMQDNKGMVNLMFYLFAIMSMCIFYIFWEKLYGLIEVLCKNKILNNIFAIYSKYSYSIFLWHPLAFLLLPVIIQYYNLNFIYQQSDALSFIVNLIYLLLACTLLGKFLGRIEDRCK